LPARGLLPILLALGAASCEVRPEARSGVDADALARRLADAVHADAWARTGAVTWRFAGKNTHLWDRQRGLIRVGWGEIEVIRWLDRDAGLAFEQGRAVPAERLAELLRDAYARWVNDSFWLNPISKLFDDGVVRGVVSGGDLLVRYTRGGLTPGDAYAWHPGPDGLPVSWRLWTSNVPIAGMRATWEGWTRLRTGALVSTRHVIGPYTLVIDQVDGAESVAALTGGADPFAPLLEAFPSGEADSQPAGR
jgi:hypothetical protein